MVECTERARSLGQNGWTLERRKRKEHVQAYGKPARWKSELAWLLLYQAACALFAALKDDRHDPICFSFSSCSPCRGLR
jgi:hypothetical protein